MVARTSDAGSEHSSGNRYSPRMRYSFVLVLLVACSKGEDKAAPGSEPGAGSGPATAGPTKAEKTVKGTLELGGALGLSVSWKPDLALTCACINEKEWAVEATMSDGKETFVSVNVNTVNGTPDGVRLTSLKVSSARSEPGVGISGACKPDMRNTDGVISADLDAKLTGTAGDVTVKGHLDVVCREGL